jgi:STE24 endopeptidase
MALDVDAATAAIVNAMGPERLARAAAYTTGGHWLLLWGVVISLCTAWIVARSEILSRWIPQRADRPNRTAALSAAVFVLASSLLTLPWTVYADWYRERSYGRTSQPLSDFLGQLALSTAIGTVITAALLTAVYLFLRRTGRRWWVWATGFVALGMAALMLAAPVVIEPLFNRFEPLPAGAVRDALVPMAQAAGVPPQRIYVYDGSRQSNNFTANAGGVGSTARIAVSDVAFNGASLAEVRAVTGHEIGHYVLHHSLWGIVLGTFLALLSFWVAQWAYPHVARRLGIQAAFHDPAGLPALSVTVSLLLFIATPALNTLSRHFESEADRYSLEHVGEPDGLATALVKTADYRNPRPGTVEEIVFYDHPSVQRRVRAAMVFKSEHPALPAVDTADAPTP